MDGPGELSYVAEGEDDDGPGWSVLELPARETVGFAPSLRCFPRSWDSEPPAWSVKSELEPVRVESLTFTQVI